MDAPYALALTAGLLAAVNPCGFALLPAYVSLLVLDGSSDGGPAGDRPAAGRPAGGRPAGGHPAGGRSAVGRALAVTAAVTVGFVAVFGAFGLLAGSAANVVARNLPWVTVVIGATLVGLGGWLLAGRDLPVLAPKPTRGPAVRRRFWPMVAFGVSYAVASLGCTVGPFLAVVATTFRTDSAGVGVFLAYATGMALAVGTVALAVALARASVVDRMRRFGSVVGRVGGGLLVLSGLYVGWYGAYELRVFRGADPADPVVTAATRIQGTIADGLDALGWPGALAVFAVVLVGAVAVPLLRGRRRPPPTP